MSNSSFSSQEARIPSKPYLRGHSSSESELGTSTQQIPKPILKQTLGSNLSSMLGTGDSHFKHAAGMAILKQDDKEKGTPSSKQCILAKNQQK